MTYEESIRIAKKEYNFKHRFDFTSCKDCKYFIDKKHSEMCLGCKWYYGCKFENKKY